MKIVGLTVLVIGLGYSFLPLTASVVAQEKDRRGNQEALKKDLADVQGVWERTVADGAGQMYRVVKEHRDNKTTQRVLNDKGEVVTAHASEFTLQRNGGVRVFTYFNRKITDGPNKGQETKGEQSYVYRVEGDTFWENGADCTRRMLLRSVSSPGSA